MLLLAPLTALGLVLIQWGLGRLVPLPLRDDTWLERNLTHGAIGFALTTLLLLTLAYTGFFSPALLAGLYWALLLAVIIREWRAIVAWIPGGLLRISDEVWTPMERACLPVLALFIALCAFYALAPSTTWDPLDYHYELPRRWLLNGHFFDQPGIIYHQFPSSTELHFGWLMAVESDLAANQYTIILIATFFLAAIALGVRYCSRQAAVAGILAVAGLPLVFTEQAQGGVIDCALGTYMLLALGRAFRWRVSRDNLDFLLMAFCGGMAVSIKHSGWMLGFFLFGLLVVDSIARKEKLGRGIERAVALGVCMFAMVFPWYYKSFIEMGNPVWPFADSLFNGTPKHYADILYWSNPNFTRDPWDLITWWFEVTFSVPLTQYRFRLLTPIYLGLLPMLLVFRRHPGPHLQLLAFCAFQIGVLLYQAPGEPRYMLPAWALLGILLVYAVEKAGWFRLKYGGLVVAAMLLLPMGLSLAMLQVESRDKLPFIKGEDDRWESYARRVETYPAIAYVEAHLQPGERVLHGDPRVYCYKDTSMVDIIYPLDHPGVPSWTKSELRILQQWHHRKVRFVTLSAGAHYMGLTRATLLRAQERYSEWKVDPDQQLYVQSLGKTDPVSVMDRGIDNQLGWNPYDVIGAMPESPLGPLTARTLELGAFTTREVRSYQLADPMSDSGTPELFPTYTVDVPALQQRWNDIDIQIILTLEKLIDRGYLTKVLDNPACPVWEVTYPADWGPPGTDLEDR